MHESRVCSLCVISPIASTVLCPNTDAGLSMLDTSFL